MPSNGPVFLLLTAAGSSTRFGGSKKELLAINGSSILQHSLQAFADIADLAGVVITHPAGGKETLQSALSPWLLAHLTNSLPCGLDFVEGGASRQISVANGLARLLEKTNKAHVDPKSAIVLIHDAARPWVSATLIAEVIKGTRQKGACIPVCDLTDTPKIIGMEGYIADHPSRDKVKGAQTPQGFILEALASAHAEASAEEWVCTDDSSLWAKYCGPVLAIPGELSNKKITYRSDIPSPPTSSVQSVNFRIGEGWDIHPLVPNRKLLLGGVHIEHDRGEAGHSDGDVLWHAISDALLGALSLGDIGTYFPPTDNRWKDADSSDLARSIYTIVRDKGWGIQNLDTTVILEKPKLSLYKTAIREKIAQTLEISVDTVSIKAKTNEGFAEIGRGEAVEARAIVLLARL